MTPINEAQRDAAIDIAKAVPISPADAYRCLGVLLDYGCNLAVAGEAVRAWARAVSEQGGTLCIDDLQSELVRLSICRLT